MTDKINELLRRVEEFNPKGSGRDRGIPHQNPRQERRTERPDGRFQNGGSGTQTRARPAAQQTQNHGARPHQQPARTAAGRSLRRRRRNRRHDPPRFGRTTRFAPSDFAGQEPDRRGLLAAGLHRRRRSRNRGRLACLLGAQLPARTPGARHAGHLLHREESRHPAAHAHLVDSGAHHGAPEAAHPRHLPRPRLPQRSPSPTAPTASSTRSKDSTSTKESRSPT